MSFPEMFSFFPKHLDADAVNKISSVTLERYRKSLAGFVQFLVSQGCSPQCLSQVDLFAAHYKRETDLSRTQLDILIASLEYFYPSLKKGGLDYCKQASAGKAAKHRTKHTVPLVSKPCRLFGAHMAARGKTRMGYGIAFQQATALRPCELRILCKNHVMRPENDMGKFIIRLGADVGTKVKREQYAVLDSFQHTDFAWLLCLLLDATPDGGKLFPFSYNSHNSTISDIEAHLGLKLGATPHSPRAGFASEGAALGTPVSEIREKGRWQSELSFKMYVDVIVAAQVQSMCSLSTLSAGMQFTATDFAKYFSFEAFLAEAVGHGTQGLRQVQRRMGAEGDGHRSLEAYALAHSDARTLQATHGNGGQRERDGVPKRRAANSTSASPSAKGVGKGGTPRNIPKGFR